MQVCLRVLRKVEVDDHVDSLNVNSAREEVCIAIDTESAGDPCQGSQIRCVPQADDAQSTVVKASCDAE